MKHKPFNSSQSGGVYAAQGAATRPKSAEPLSVLVFGRINLRMRTYLSLQIPIVVALACAVLYLRQQPDSWEEWGTLLVCVLCLEVMELLYFSGRFVEAAKRRKTAEQLPDESSFAKRNELV